jgi:uncharacterized membrane protein HdeD (DUF308 family)
MLEFLTRYWWAVAVRGAAALLFGIMALIWPGVTIAVLVLLFGAYALVDGAIALGTAISGRGRDRRWMLVLQGVVGILAGVLTFIWPGITAMALLLLIAAWALVTGILGIVAAIWLRREVRGEWLLALGGALSVLFGIVLLVRPGVGALAVVWMIGLYSIIFGVAMLALGFQLRRLRDRPGQVPGAHRPAPA